MDSSSSCRNSSVHFVTEKPLNKVYLKSSCAGLLRRRKCEVNEWRLLCDIPHNDNMCVCLPCVYCPPFLQTRSVHFYLKLFSIFCVFIFYTNAYG